MNLVLFLYLNNRKKETSIFAGYILSSLSKSYIRTWLKLLMLNYVSTMAPLCKKMAAAVKHLENTTHAPVLPPQTWIFVSKYIQKLCHNQLVQLDSPGKSRLV